MPVDPHRLLVLRAVHRTGGVSAAAAALNLTPSAVSQQLTRLEAELRLTLLDRTRRGGGRAATLTTAGVTLAQRADDVALALAEAQREADRLREGARGTVRVGGFATALGHLVVPTIANLGISDPALQVQVVEVTQTEGTTMLRAGELDLLIGERYVETTAPGARAHPGLWEEDLRRDPFRIVVPAIWAMPERFEDVLGGPWVSTPRHRPPQRILAELCTRHGVTSGHEHLCTESQTQLALVAAGLGAAIIPELTLSYLSTEGVTVYGTPADTGSRLLTVAGSRRTDRSSAAERFLAALREIVVLDGGLLS